jgi:hypothetical protein
LAKGGIGEPHEDRFWDFLSAATISLFQDIILEQPKGPHRAFAEAVQCGLLRCTEHCLLNVKSAELRESLLCRVIAEACNYFTVHSGLRAIGHCYSKEVTSELFARYPNDQYPMIKSYSRSIVESGDAFKGDTDRFVNVCSNLNVRCLDYYFDTPLH